MPLQPRDHGLAHEVEYILDSATEENEILGFHRAILDLYGDAKIIDEIVSGPREDGKRRLAWRRGMTLDLCRYAESIFPDIDNRVKVELVEVAYSHARKIVVDYADFYSGWNFEDVVKGGCMMSLHYRRIRRDQSPTKGAVRHLRSPKAIRRYVWQGRDTMDFLPERLAILNRIERPTDITAGDALMAVMEDSIRIRRDRQYAAMKAVMAAHKKRPWEIRRETRSRRKIITRAAVMAVGVLGAANVSAFARGEAVRIEGQEIHFDVRPRASLAAMGHGAIEVSLVRPDGTPLSKLCVYHDETPALDQLTAMALRVAAGQEQEIIQAGNLYLVQDGAAEHEALRGKLTAKPGEATMRATWDRDSAFLKHRGAYQRELAPVYREAVAQFLFGRRAKEFV